MHRTPGSVPVTKSLSPSLTSSPVDLSAVTFDSDKRIPFLPTDWVLNLVIVMTPLLEVFWFTHPVGSRPQAAQKPPQGLHIYCVSHGSGNVLGRHGELGAESVIAANEHCGQNLSGAVPKLFLGVPFLTHQITEIGHGGQRTRYLGA